MIRHLDRLLIVLVLAAANLVLTAEQASTLDRLTPAEGGHHNDAQMQMIVGRRPEGQDPTGA